VLPPDCQAISIRMRRIADRLPAGEDLAVTRQHPGPDLVGGCAKAAVLDPEDRIAAGTPPIKISAGDRRL
jgi:hypothetical protein